MSWKLKDLKPNPDNPRVLRDEKFRKLRQSIQDFPKMMELRPIVVDQDNMVLGGNMRLRVLQDLGFTNLPDGWVKRAEDLTDEEKRRFVITDNVGFGEWDWDILANEWDAQELAEWGLDVPAWITMQEPDGDDLLGEEKANPATMKITFDGPEQLQKAEIDIRELLDRKYPEAYFSVSAGEI